MGSARGPIQNREGEVIPLAIDPSSAAGRVTAVEISINNDVRTLNSVQDAWRKRAYAQGVLCLICCEPPRFEQREEFYDTGVCEFCSEERGEKVSPKAF